jgi:hypothetical protein
MKRVGKPNAWPIKNIPKKNKQNELWREATHRHFPSSARNQQQIWQHQHKSTSDEQFLKQRYRDSPEVEGFPGKSGRLGPSKQAVGEQRSQEKHKPLTGDETRILN